jgi:hypothetical protein
LTLDSLVNMIHLQSFRCCLERLNLVSWKIHFNHIWKLLKSFWQKLLKS